MCIILPVDHLPCTHTVAIFQHCVDAPRSRLRGLGPCSKVRQHSRPIITRKLCINCGGPRYFARRGGIAERGVSGLQLRKRGGSDPNDSGYHSDIIEEEEEEDIASETTDSAISPRASVARTSWKPLHRHNYSTDSFFPDPHRLSLLAKRSSWKPNLKHELSRVHSGTFYRPESTASEKSLGSQFEDAIGRARKSQWPLLDTSDALIRPGLTKRKNSSLLHPSRPDSQSDSDCTIRQESIYEEDSIDRFEMPAQLEHGQKNYSTLLHPSSAEVSDLESGPEQGPESGLRKGSTLLHPSSPESPARSLLEIGNAFHSPLIPSHSSSSSTSTIISTASTPDTLLTIPSPNNMPTFGRSNSVRTNFTKIWKDEEEEEYLWPSDQDAEIRSCNGADESVKAEVATAKTAKLARASTVQVHVRGLSVSI
ncbi:hypothetical protein CC78DRAFT_246023 [Lojkania enalia]|uniref:Uncharacterized protein n=1 Tax=Lojkania enalia TaxID=147567 RepID=A0A9P4N3A4_9PLEO|nr:hypothetical protein CC78DRAFT_246023 [Didymosphaeria enalia]